MAFTIPTIYTAIDKNTPILRKMEKATNSFANRQDKAFKQVGNTLANLKNQLLGLAGGLSIASLVAIGGGALKNYDSNLQSLSAITGVTGKSLDAFKKEALITANDVKRSSVDMLKAFELVGSAKPELLSDAKALGEVSKQAIILGKAGNLLPEDSVNALTISLNQFGAGAEQAAKYTDILATAQQKGSGPINYLSQAIVNSGGTMKAFGNSFEDTIAILEGFAKAGVPASEAGTMLSGIMSKLAKSNKREFNPQYTKATDIINNLSKANLSYAELMELTDDRGAKWLTTIINQNQIVQELTGNLNEVGNAQAQADIKARSFSERLIALRARFENLIISGNESSGVLNRFGNVIGFVTNHLDKILAVTGSVIGLYASWYGIMSAIRIATTAYNVVLGVSLAFQKAVPISLAANATAMKAYAFSTKLATVATWLFSAALWANPITWIVIGVMALIAGIVLLIKHWDKVKAKIDEWSNSAVFQIIAIINPIVKVIELIAFMQDRWEGIKKAFKDGGFLEGIKAIGRALLSFVLKPVEVILKTIGKIPKMDWASNASNSIEKFRNSLDEGLLSENKKEEPVNVKRAQNDAVTKRNEEFIQNTLSIEFTNKTDKKANVKSAPLQFPFITNTY